MAGHDSLFEVLVMSLGNAALVALGLVPDPDTKRTERNLENVQQNVDFLSMLKDKTKGNLSPAEDQMLSGLLYDLQMKFVAAKKDLG